MPDPIPCDCGEVLEPKEDLAGQTITCHCGRRHVVPELSDLCPVSATGSPEPAENRNENHTLQDFADLAHRIDFEAFGHLADAIVAKLTQLEAKFPGRPGLDIQLGLVFYPDGQRAFELQHQPPMDDEPILEEICRVTDEVAAPEIVEGPVSLVVRRMLWGGAPEIGLYPFRTPFEDSIPPRKEITWDQLFARLVRTKKWGPSFWTRWRRVGQLHFRRTVETDEPHGWVVRWFPFRLMSRKWRDTLLEIWDQRLVDQSVEGLTQAIERQPWQPQYRWARAKRHLVQGQYQEAVEDCDFVLKRVGRLRDGLIRRAVAYWFGQERAKALADLNEAIAIDPHHAVARDYRGRIFHEIGAYAKAEEDFRVAIEVCPRHATFRVQLANALWPLGRYDETIAVLKAALKIDPNHPHALEGLVECGCILAENRSVDRATWEELLSMCERGIQLLPAFAYFWAQKARVQWNLGDYERAIASADQALRIDQNAGLALTIRGMCRQRLNQFSGCIEDCARAIELGSPGINTYIAKAWSHAALDDLPMALDTILAGVAAFPESPVIQNCAGHLYLRHGEVQAAIERLTEAIRLAPQWSEPYIERSRAHRLDGNTEAALSDLDQAIELAPENYVAHGERAMGLMAMGNYTAAEAGFSRALELVPTVAEGWQHRATCRMHLGRSREALEDLEKAVQLAPELHDPRFHRAQAKAMLGDHDGALLDYDFLIERFPDKAPAFLGRGALWIQIGQFRRAREDFAAASARDPDAAESHRVLRYLMEASHAIVEGKYQHAIGRCSKVLEVAEDCVPAYHIAGTANWYLGELVEAIDVYSKGLSFAENNFAIMSARGQVYAELGEHEKALEELDRALELGQAAGVSPADLAYSRSGRALALTGLGRHEEAEAELERSILDCPQNAWVYFNKGISFHSLGQKHKAAICFEVALSLTEPALPERKKAQAKGYCDSMRRGLAVADGQQPAPGELPAAPDSGTALDSMSPSP